MIVSDRLFEPFRHGHDVLRRTATPSAATRCRPRSRWRTSTSSSARASTRTCTPTKAPFRADAWRSCSTCRSSATCAATGYFYGIELVKDKATKETFDDDESRAPAARLPVQGALRRRPLLPRRRPRRPGGPARPAADHRPAGVRRDRADPARRAHRGLVAALTGPRGDHAIRVDQVTGRLLDRHGLHDRARRVCRVGIAPWGRASGGGASCRPGCLPGCPGGWAGEVGWMAGASLRAADRPRCGSCRGRPAAAADPAARGDPWSDRRHTVGPCRPGRVSGIVAVVPGGVVSATLSVVLLAAFVTQFGALQTAPILIAVVTAFLTMEGVTSLLAAASGPAQPRRSDSLAGRGIARKNDAPHRAGMARSAERGADDECAED